MILGGKNTARKSTWKQHSACLRELIGRTPMFRLTCRFRGTEYTVFAKHETLNFTGSIKDRMALHILELAYRTGKIRPSDVIAEATSGNTGIAFAAIGRAFNHDVRIFMPDWMSRERKLLIKSMGAEIVDVSKAEGGFLGSIDLSTAYARDNDDVFLPRQFQNEANVMAHFETTGPEIYTQLESQNLKPTAFVAGVGTGGTVMGVGRYLRSKDPEVRVHPLEPANSPTLRTGEKVGTHRIQGISDEFIPSIVKLNELDRIVDTWDGDAILMAQRLASELGIGVGISSGANLLGALQIASEQGPESNVVTVFPDSNKKYLSTDLCNSEPILPEYHSPDVELLHCEVVACPPQLATPVTS